MSNNDDLKARTLWGKSFRKPHTVRPHEFFYIFGVPYSRIHAIG